MLVLARKIGEEIVIDGEITVKVVAVSGSRVRLAIDAPRHVNIRRVELDHPVLKDKGVQPTIRRSARHAETVPA